MNDYLALVGAALTGALLPYVWPSSIPRHLEYILGFAGSYLVSINILHVLPELFEHATASSPPMGMGILIGFFAQALVETFAHGIAHGHVYSQHVHTPTPTSSWPFSLPMVLGLCVHALFDGLMLAGPCSSSHIHHGLLTGIVLHKVPAALAFTTLLIQQGTSRLLIAVYIALFTLSSPLGLYMGESGLLHGNSLLLYLNALGCGSLLHIGMSLVFESAPHHTSTYRKFLSHAAGVLLAWLGS